MYKTLFAGIFGVAFSLSAQAQPIEKSSTPLPRGATVAGVLLNTKWAEQSKKLPIKTQSCESENLSGARGVVVDKICAVTMKKAPAFSNTVLFPQLAVFLKNGTTVGVAASVPFSKTWSKQEARSIVNALYEQSGQGPYLDADIDVVIERDATTAWYFKESITNEGTQELRIGQGVKDFIFLLSN